MSKSFTSADEFLDDEPAVAVVAVPLQTKPEPTVVRDDEAAPSLPYEVFKGPFADMAGAVADSRSIGRVYAYAAAMTTVSALCARGLYAVRDNAPELKTYANLFVIIQGETGWGKSEGLGPFSRFLAKLEGEVVDEWKAERSRLCAEQAELEKELGGSRKPRGAPLTAEAAGNRQISDEAAAAKWQRLGEIQDRLKLGAPAFVDGAPTEEGLLKRMKTWRESAFVCTAEGEALNQAMAGRYSDGNAMFGTLCSLYTREAVNRGRANQDNSVKLDDPMLTVYCGTQEDQVMKLRNSDEVLRRGLLGRFLWIMGELPPLAYVERNLPRVPAVVNAAFEKECRALFEAFCNPRYVDEPRAVKFDARAAHRLHELMVHKVNHTIREGDKVNVRRDELVGRLSLVLHVMEHGVGSPRHPISLQTVLDAERLVDVAAAPWAEYEADRKADADEKALKAIAEKVRRDKAKGLTGRDIGRLLHWSTGVRDAFLKRMVDAAKLKVLPPGVAEKSPKYAPA